MTYTQRLKKHYYTNADRTVFGGRKYMSKFEASVAQDLDLLMKGGKVVSYEPQHRLKLIVKGKHICDYIADFLVTMKDGSQEIWEPKGFSTPLFRYKWKLAQALFDNKYKFVLIQQV